MHIFDNDNAVSNIYQRALALYISKQFASKQTGQDDDQQKISEQSNQRRELLAVEEEARQEKIIKEHGESHFRNRILMPFMNDITTQVNAELDSKESHYNTVFSVEDAAPAMLEILSTRTASINRITPLVKSLPWLCEEVVNLVNKPQYRKRANVKVTDPRLAISFIGLDNLKLLMPTFILKNWLPISTSPFPLMKRRVWNDSLSIALTAKALAEHHELDWFTAFTAGMFSNIGFLAVSRCFLQKYNDKYNADLRLAFDEKDKKVHDIMVQFKLPPESLITMINTHSHRVGADLIELMRFDRLPITEVIFDLAHNPDFPKMCPIAQLVAKAKAYVAYRSLAKEYLIEPDEAKALLQAVKFTPAELALLKKSDITNLKLKFN
jgi:HD-like signal output (HDOD) protein